MHQSCSGRRRPWIVGTKSIAEYLQLSHMDTSGSLMLSYYFSFTFADTDKIYVFAGRRNARRWILYGPAFRTPECILCLNTPVCNVFPCNYPQVVCTFTTMKNCFLQYCSMPSMHACIFQEWLLHTAMQKCTATKSQSNQEQKCMLTQLLLCLLFLHNTRTA